jgi:hypothetical protein
MARRILNLGFIQSPNAVEQIQGPDARPQTVLHQATVQIVRQSGTLSPLSS